MDCQVNEIVTTYDGKKYVRADRQVISGDNPLIWQTQVEDYINKSIRKGKDVNVITDNGSILTIKKILLEKQSLEITT